MNKRSAAAACAAILLFSLSTDRLAAAPIPDHADAFLATYCLDCHDGDSEKGGINLDTLDIDWSDPSAYALWERVIDVVEDGEMPPQDKPQPESAKREKLAQWLDRELIAHAPETGTAPRRLNRAEYARTVRALFGIDFELPPGFPEDQKVHGFDNQAAALILSPPLMEAYGVSADLIADTIFPPEQPSAASRLTVVSPEAMTISYSSAAVRDGALRLGMKCDTIVRSCSWPAKFEAKASGIYRVKLALSAFRPTSEEPLRFELRSHRDGERSVKTQRLLGEFEVGPGDPQEFEVEVPLYEGETVLFYYANAPFESSKDARREFEAYLKSEFENDPRFLAAWLSVELGNSLRGGLGWERVKEQMANPELDLSKNSPSAIKSLLRTMTGNTVLYAETLVFRVFEEGPAMNIHGVEIEGPLQIIDGPKEKKQQAVQKRLLGDRGALSEIEQGKAALNRLLTNAFRRPARPVEVEAYWQIVAEHLAKGHDFDDGMHLAIRTVLRSPHFLYRELNPDGEISQYELASRLAYLWLQKPPDAALLKLAEQGKLRDPNVREQETRRLLKRAEAKDFIRTFSAQWLHVEDLAEIMPDPRLVDFTDADRKILEGEIEQLFTVILRENRPLTDFIQPDFLFTNDAVAKKIYGMNQWPKGAKKGALTRISLEPGSRHGGILGSAAVMMATANGVDTQPVMRGVWVLENILGDAPPPPPDAVPAITPDTRGTDTIRDLLKAHTQDPNCAGCHQMMDPLGLVLENFDAVGRWRETYPIYETDAKGKSIEKPGFPIDATGTLKDGTELRDVTDLKAWVVEHIDVFAACLGEKFLIYATGRELNYAERQEIEQIATNFLANDEGFEDFLIALVRSETFAR